MKNALVDGVILTTLIFFVAVGFSAASRWTLDHHHERLGIAIALVVTFGVSTALSRTRQ